MHIFPITVHRCSRTLLALQIVWWSINISMICYLKWLDTKSWSGYVKWFQNQALLYVVSVFVWRLIPFAVVSVVIYIAWKRINLSVWIKSLCFCSHWSSERETDSLCEQRDTSGEYTFKFFLTLGSWHNRKGL